MISFRLIAVMFFLVMNFFVVAHAASRDPENTNTNTNANTSTSTSSENADTAKPKDIYYVNPKDPYEKFNRAVYKFNDIVDRGILKPVATAYIKIVPKPLSKGISNFYYNINTVPTVVNDVLQGSIYQATNDSWRLAINSTVGLLGFFDFASDMGLEPNVEDFGLTLARWGYTNSNYLVIPFFGPSTVRDGIGIPVDYYLFSVYPYIYPIRTRYIVYFGGVVSKRADLLHFQNVMEQAAIDRYAFLRDAYLQRRTYLIERNKELGDPYLNKEKDKDKESQEEKAPPK